MPSALVAALAAPIRKVEAMVGPGWSGDPSADPATVLADVRDALTEASAATDRSWQHAGERWSGAGADGASGFAAATITAVDAVAMRAGQLGRGAGAAAEAVARARARLRAIAERFEARAAALEPDLDTPGTAEELLDEAQRALTEAIAVVDELRAELDGQAAALADRPASPAPTAPAGFSGGGPPGWASGAGGPAPASPVTGGAGDFAAPAPAQSDSAATALMDPAAFGEGVAVRLPDGTTVMAPNAVAASAVRHALTQLGVPYQWGGSTPGVGLDCSGLTQWAYREAGVGLPRLAQEQDVGTEVGIGSLRPGDLAVWDGHVAMIVGDGMMIEAGDPVQLSPVRTTNAGQGFHGFFRPTS